VHRHVSTALRERVFTAYGVPLSDGHRVELDSSMRTTFRFADVPPGWRCPKCAKWLSDKPPPEARAKADPGTC
jgi:hypothetical protein